MKLLTLNTHSLIEPDYEAKREIFVNFIAAEQPEVFALQEVNQTVWLSSRFSASVMGARLNTAAPSS